MRIFAGALERERDATEMAASAMGASGFSGEPYAMSRHVFSKGDGDDGGDRRE